VRKAHGRSLAAVEREIVREGLDEGYPECCVLWFVLVWFPLIASVDHDREPGCMCPHEFTAWLVWTSYADLMRDLHPGYVPCPACLLRMLNEVDRSGM
jgi:hypothetical protein